jgi:carotenoid cleavage dioxygenase
MTDTLAATTGRQPLPGVDRAWGPNTANTHVIAHAGHILALCEVGTPYEMSPELETIGRYDFAGSLTTNMTAHPKIDPETGDLHFFAYRPRRPFVTYYRADRSGRMTCRATVDVAGPTIMHDFAITRRFAVFLDQPLVFNRSGPSGGGLPFRWDPDYRSRIGLLPTDRPDDGVRWFDVDTPYIPHVMNAFEEGDDVVLRAVVSDAFTLTGGSPSSLAVTLREWRLDLLTGRVRQADLADLPAELPRIDERRVGRPHRYGYAMEVRPQEGWAASGGLVKYDFASSTVTTHDFGPHVRAAEPVFVPAHDLAGEDEGWILSYLYDERDDRSRLVVLDAQAFDSPPVAMVVLPQRVAFGAHGSWIPG